MTSVVKAYAGYILLILSIQMRAAAIAPVTVDDLVRRAEILRISLAPDASKVAFLTLRAVPEKDCYDVSLQVVFLGSRHRRLVLARYVLSPAQAFEADTGSLRTTAGQFYWNSHATALVYTVHRGASMQLREHDFLRTQDFSLLFGFEWIEITEGAGDMRMKTYHRCRETVTRIPKDWSLRVQDGFRFYGPLVNPKLEGKFLIERWRYSWQAHRIAKAGAANISYLDGPAEWKPNLNSVAPKKPHATDQETYFHDETPSPDGQASAMVEELTTDFTDPLRTQRTARIILRSGSNETAKLTILVPEIIPREQLSILGWSTDGQDLYYVATHGEFTAINEVSRNGRVRLLYRDGAGLGLPSRSSQFSAQHGVVILVRSTNVTPDELVLVHLKSGKSEVLASPNASFEHIAKARVRLITIPCCSKDFYGRLYLPADSSVSDRYPLLFTQYVSSPGFYASVGDEIPILALVNHGIAVFAMSSHAANNVSRTADPRWELARVQEPLKAMEWVYHELVREGVVDPQHCGLSGVSYGAEIALYSYWKSHIFTAVSAATASWEPMNYFLAGISYSKYLDSRGFSLPTQETQQLWRQLSAGLNARPDLPPLLLQSGDGEEYFGNVELWFRLRRMNAPVEWYLYPNEGHIKRSPAARWWTYRRNLDWFCFWLKHKEVDRLPQAQEQYERWSHFAKLPPIAPNSVP